MIRSPRRRFLLVAIALGLICAALLLSLASRATPRIRERAIASLNERLRSEVDLESLQVSVFPRPEVRGTGLSVRHHGRRDVEPLIRIGSYSANVGLWGLLRSPLRLRTVELERLEISIPPGGIGRPGPEPPQERATPATQKEVEPERKRSWRLVVDHMVARTARVEIVSRDPGKLPRVFAIHDLVMRGLGDGAAAAFEAALTNPQPRGEITTHGTFGPWQAEDPRQTPLRGEYVFDSANLDTIKGVAGTLSSRGAYSGVVERIDVKGDTDTPDFAIDLAGQPVHLRTRFQAIVDGTSGDTWLERVDARVIETLIVARGAVVRSKDVKGRHVSLAVTIDDGRIEDVLTLGVRAAKPIMTGRMRLNAKLLLPAGDRTVVERLELAGKFSLDKARFTNVNIQEKIDTLSRYGKGSDAIADGASVVSRLSGTFTLRAASLAFSHLSFGVPGSVVQLAGTYDLRREALDFRGHLLLDATLAETTSGWKAVVAKAAQPLFRRPGGGSKIPIRISGTREKPKFGLDVRRVLGPG